MYTQGLSPCKRTQHCWPTTPNIVGCYMSCPFAHPVACCCMLLGVVTQSLKPVKRSTTCNRSQQLPILLGQQCWELLRSFAFSFINIWSSKTRLLVLASRLRRTLLPPSLDRKRRSSKRKWERSNSSHYDSFDPMTPARLPLCPVRTNAIGSDKELVL